MNRIALSVATLVFLAPSPARVWGGPPAPASQPAEAPLIGVRVHSERIRQGVGTLEQAKSQEAIDGFKKALRAAQHGPQSELNELRLGLGIVLLRSGDVSAARKTLLPLSQLKDKSDVRWRAEVLCGVAARAGRPGKSSASLQSREAWRDALTTAFDEWAAKMATPHQKISTAIAAHRWPDVSRAIEQIHDVQDRLSIFEVDELRLRQADLIADHARMLAGEVRDINVVIAQAMNDASDLAGHMKLKFDLNPKHK